jgi:hypothetical protein
MNAAIEAALAKVNVQVIAPGFPGASVDPAVIYSTVANAVNAAMQNFGAVTEDQLKDVIKDAMGAAKLTADEHSAQELSDAIAKAFPTTIPATVKEVVDALDAAGYNVNHLAPLTEGKFFCWNEGTKTIVLAASVGAGQVDIYEDGKSFINVEVSAESAILSAITEGNDVTLTQDILLTTHSLTVAAGKDVTIDLNGHKIVLPEYNNGKVDRHSYVETYGKLTIIGGEIQARGVQAYNGGELTIKGTKVVALDADAGAAIYAWAGSKITVEGGEFIASEGAECVINAGGIVTINGGTFTHTTTNSDSRAYTIETNNGGVTTIANATVFGARGLFACKGNGSVTTITSGTYVTTGLNGGWCVYTDRDSDATSTAKVIINGGTFEGPQMFFGNYEDKR